METRSRNGHPSSPSEIQEHIAITILENQNHNPIENARPSFSSEIHNDTPTGSADSSSTLEIQNDISTRPGWPPSLQLLKERKEKHKLCVDLFKAAVEGDASKAKRLFKDYPESMLLRVAITEKHETVLHVAAGANQTLFVEKMINLMKDNESWTLNLQNKKGNNAFCYAAMAGSIPTAYALLKEDISLLKIRGAAKMTPLYLAALFGQKVMALYLYEKMKKNFFLQELKVEDRKAIFFISIRNTLYELALKLLQDDDNNQLATGFYSLEGDELTDQTPLHPLARTPLHLLDQISKTDKTALSNKALELIELIWEKILKSEGAQVGKYFEDHKDLLFDAAELGNIKFLDKIIQLYPDLVHLRDANNRTIFHIAIMRRHVNLFKLIEKIGFNKQLIVALDEDGNSLLHLAAKYPEPSPVTTVPGAALEMQHELRIFKDVESLVMPSFRELKNKMGKTPRELFTTTHAVLLEK